MHDDPSITIIFNPLTLEPTKIFFKARIDTETTRLREILAAGIRSRTDEKAAQRKLQNATTRL